jgi:hypothetical protein
MSARWAHVTPAARDRGELSMSDDFDALPYALRGIARSSNDRVMIA